MNHLDLMTPPRQPIDAPIWAASEPIYWCLCDIERTEAFILAINRTVRPGDVVLDAGTGTGIFALAAARAGATVLAVEIDPRVAVWVAETLALNNLSDRVTVITGDAREVALPENVDVVIAEMVETGLLDEQQVPVLNALHQRGVIGPATRLIPERYSTRIELVEYDDTFFGFHIACVVHDWRTFAHPNSGWHHASIRALTDPTEVLAVDFRDVVAPRVDHPLTLRATSDGRANGVRISGLAHLGPDISLGATNSLNGLKVLPLPEPMVVRAGQEVTCRMSYTMGGGMGTFRWQVED